MGLEIPERKMIIHIYGLNSKNTDGQGGMGGNGYGKGWINHKIYFGYSYDNEMLLRRYKLQYF